MAGTTVLSLLDSCKLSLQSLLEDNAKMRAEIPDMFVTVMLPLVKKVSAVSASAIMKFHCTGVYFTSLSLTIGLSKEHVLNMPRKGEIRNQHNTRSNTNYNDMQIQCTV